MIALELYALELENLLAQLERDVENLGYVLSLNDWTRTVQISTGISDHAPLTRNQFSRVFDYSATLLNLYSFYEGFIHDSTTIWLRFLSKNPVEYDRGKLASIYSLGVALILQKIDTSPRYAHLSRDEVIKSLHDAVTPDSEASYFFEAFSADLNNLRFVELENLCAKLQLTGLREWLANNNNLQRICEEQAHSIDSRLKDFIDRRNEVAHGRRSNEIYALRPLQELGDFIVELCRSFYEFLLHFMLFKVAPSKLGKITERLPNAGAYILTTTTHSLNVGTTVYVVKGSCCKRAQILELQINGMQAEIVVPANKTEVGLRLSLDTSRGSALYVNS